MTVDAERLVGEFRHHRVYDLLDLEGKRAAVRLAQVDGVGTRLVRCAHACDRVVGVGLVAVEEVLGVEHHAPTRRLEIGDRIGDHAQVLLERGLQRARHLLVPGLAHDGEHGSAARDEVGEALVVCGGHALAARAAERGDLRMGERRFAHRLEKGDVFGIRRGKTALDVVDAEQIEPTHDAQLVLKRKRDALALFAVAQRAVIRENASMFLHEKPFRQKRKFPA